MTNNSRSSAQTRRTRPMALRRLSGGRPDMVGAWLNRRDWSRPSSSPTVCLVSRAKLIAEPTTSAERRRLATPHTPVVSGQQKLKVAGHSKRRRKSVWSFDNPLNGEAVMQSVTRALLLLGAMALPAPGAAQTTPAPSGIARTVVAATTLPIVIDAPLHFIAVSVTLPPSEKSSVSAADGVLYQMLGSTEVSLDGETKMLKAGEGLYIAGGKTAALTAGTGAPSTFLHFFLVSAADLGRPAETPPAAVKELYRTVQPIPDLKPGSYDLNLTRVTFPAQMPSNPPHHRSGAALYFIISGTGANTIDGKTETRGPGSLIYEPHTLVHQWGNPGNEPLVFLAFNINPEGMAAVLPEAPAKKQ